MLSFDLCADVLAVAIAIAFLGIVAAVRRRWS
jgi:hypothetical protein